MAMLTSHHPGPIGLLSTVKSLPLKYRSRYIISVGESPLDLTVKTDKFDFKTNFNFETIAANMSPIKKRFRDADFSTVTDRESCSPVDAVLNSPVQVVKKFKTDDINSNDTSVCPDTLEKTPTKSITKTIKQNKHSKKQPPKEEDAHKSDEEKLNKKPKKSVVRKLKFDEMKSSPVSGTIIKFLDKEEQFKRDEDNVNFPDDQNCDIDPKYNWVDISDEARLELSKIENVIGDFICKLCKLEFEDAFHLARHRCCCFILLDFTCDECGKKFNCPANLASHQRWHKPRKVAVKTDKAVKRKVGGENGGKRAKKIKNSVQTKLEECENEEPQAVRSGDEMEVHPKVNDQLEDKYERNPEIIAAFALTHLRDGNNFPTSYLNFDSYDSNSSSSTSSVIRQGVVN